MAGLQGLSVMRGQLVTVEAPVVKLWVEEIIVKNDV